MKRFALATSALAIPVACLQSPPPTPTPTHVASASTALPSPPSNPSHNPSPNAHRWLRTPASPSSLSGGTLEISRIDPNHLSFHIDVWNGAHIGEANGHALRRGNTFSWTEPTDDNPCVLTFRHAASSWIVSERGECPHGAGVVFDGTYLDRLPSPTTSFDCSSAHAPDERIVCGDRLIASLDRELARVFRLCLDARPNDAMLAEDQRAWLRSRASCVNGDPSTDQAKHAAATCVTHRYVERLAQLDASAAGKTTSFFAPLRALVANGSDTTITDVPRVEGTLRVLLDARYIAFVDYLGNAVFHRDGSYVVASGGPRGLYTSMEAWIAVGASDDLWVAILDTDEDGSRRHVELFTSSARTGKSAPPAFDAWRSRFASVPVTRIEPSK